MNQHHYSCKWDLIKSRFAAKCPQLKMWVPEIHLINIRTGNHYFIIKNIFSKYY